MNAAQMLAQPRKAYLLLHAEPELDTYDPRAGARRDASGGARGRDVAVSAHALEYAHVLLPIVAVHRNRRHVSSTPKAACRASTAWCSRSARRGRRGKCCACSATCSDCRASTTTAPRRCARSARRHRRHRRAARQRDQRRSTASGDAPPAQRAFERIGEVPIYHADAIVRRAPSLQQTRDAQAAGRLRCRGGLIDSSACARATACGSPGGGEARAAASCATTGCRELRAPRRPACRETAALGRDVRRGRAASASAAQQRASA